MHVSGLVYIQAAGLTRSAMLKFSIQYQSVALVLAVDCLRA